MVMLGCDQETLKLREELTEFIYRHESPVLETVLAVAKSFDHGILDDDEDEVGAGKPVRPVREPREIPVAFQGAKVPWYMEPLPGGRVGKILKMRVVRAIWDERHSCRMLVEYTVCGVTIRMVEYNRTNRSGWEVGDCDVWGVIAADLELLYLDKLELVEELLDGQQVD
jgi:hypothetical protein